MATLVPNNRKESGLPPVQKKISFIQMAVIPINEASGAPAKEQKKISAWFALANLLKTMVGPGCFSLPLAFKQSGWVAALTIIVVQCYLSIVTMSKLVKCSNHIARNEKCGPLNYGRMAGKSTERSWRPISKFSMIAEFIVNLSIIALQLGICCVAYIFVVYQTHELLHLVLNEVPDRHALFPMCLPAFLIIGSITCLHFQSVVSIVGNGVMLIAAVTVLWQLLMADHQPLSSLPMVGGFTGIVTAAGAVLYALEGQAMILPLENRMKKPSEMKGLFGVINLGVSITGALFVGVGFLGFLAFGQGVEDSITLNLSNSPVSAFAKALLLIGVFSSFVVQLMPVVSMIWPSIKVKLVEREWSSRKCLVSQIVFRMFLTLVIFTAAVLIPKLEDMIPLIGMTSAMMLAFTFPSLFHFLLFAPLFSQSQSKVRHFFDLLLDVFCFSLGIFFMIAGVSAKL
ncbi:unnamed protein product [Caenorhabditis auriculariae]|uniref:Amino acid transporter transmembrane domain-containing protein n=1 Tax=Caenorhabditis auriculariae TaxID=2777116 RepID=A0A8S1HJC6_9PELO|nr:unnamed protein product [Caenorhabditis auriculariae]